MRTTLNIDAELLVAAKKLAERENKTAGQVISELLRQALSARGGAQTREALNRIFMVSSLFLPVVAS